FLRCNRSNQCLSDCRTFALQYRIRMNVLSRDAIQDRVLIDLLKSTDCLGRWYCQIPYSNIHPLNDKDRYRYLLSTSRLLISQSSTTARPSIERIQKIQ